MANEPFYCDFETRSRCDLLTRGAYNYAQDPSTAVLCFSWAFGDEEVATWRPGQPFPRRVLQHIADGGQIRAHNAQFERLIFWYVLCPDLGIPEPALEQFYCTAAEARGNAFPGKLEDVGRASGSNMRKDHRGAQLIKLLSIPQEGGAFLEDEALMGEMVAYCEQDVRTMRAVSKTMRQLTDDELADYHVSERINDRGILLDKPLAEAAVRYADIETREIQDLVQEITGGAITSVRSPKMRTWVMARVGDEALRVMTVYKDGEKKFSIDKHVRANLLMLADEDPDQVPPEVADVIQCADDLWASSVAKFSKAAGLADDEDGRVRGAYQFNGAGSTHRYSSLGLQLHNYPRKCAKNSQAVRDAMVRGEPIVPTYGGRVTDVLKSMLRPSLVPKPGHVFIVADWAGIEARGLPWLSGSEAAEPRLQAFREGADVYIPTAAAIFGCSDEEVAEDHENGGTMRQIGKVTELSCFARDTLIFTDTGLKAIVDVLPTDKLWDGVEWVSHSGVVEKGVRQTVNVAGIDITPEHRLLAGRSWLPASKLVSQPSTLRLALETASGSLPWSASPTGLRADCVWSSYSAPAAPRRTWCISTTYEKAPRLDATSVQRSRPTTGESNTTGTLTSYQTTSTGAGFLGGYLPALTGAITRTTRAMTTTVVEAYGCILSGAKTAVRFLRMSSPCPGGTHPSLSWTAQMSIAGTSQGTCALSPAPTTCATNDRSKQCSSTFSSLRPVYDILNCGPRNRFFVLSAEGPLIAHNCGYAGGIGAFHAMSRNYGVRVSDDLAARAVKAWRRENGWAVTFWAAAESAMLYALRHPGTEFAAGRMSYLYDGESLWAALPSGRILRYPFCKRDGDDILYLKAAWKPSADAKEWPRARLWKGILVENGTQAICASILKWALAECEYEGIPVAGHTHDEIIAEVPEREAEEVKLVLDELMREGPPWAAGMPLDVESKIMERYGK